MKNFLFFACLGILAACNCSEKSCSPGDSLLFQFVGNDGSPVFTSVNGAMDSIAVSAIDQTGAIRKPDFKILTNDKPTNVILSLLVDEPFDLIVLKIKGMAADSVKLTTELTPGTECCGGTPVVRGVKVGQKTLGQEEFLSIITLKK